MANVKKFNGIEWIFFDLDGTLADTHSTLYNIYLKFLKKFDKEGSREEFKTLSGSLTEVIRFLKSKHKLRGSEDNLLKSYQEEVLYSYKTAAKPMANAELVLDKLNKLNYKVMLVTSATQDLALEFISKNNWNKYFQNYVFGNEVNSGKPDPAIYNFAVKKSNSKSENILAIEDSQNGILSAKRANLKTIGFANEDNGEDLMKVGADIVISELKDLLLILI